MNGPAGHENHCTSVKCYKGYRHVRFASRFAFQATQDKSLRYRASAHFGVSENSVTGFERVFARLPVSGCIDNARALPASPSLSAERIPRSRTLEGMGSERH